MFYIIEDIFILETILLIKSYCFDNPINYNDYIV
jgi:hypothetical protein